MILDNKPEEDFFVDNEIARLKQEALKKIRYGNYRLDTQLKRDIELLSLAIVHGGPLESDRVKALTLLKSILFLYFGNMCYRDASDRKLHPWNHLNQYLEKDSTLNTVPIAAILLHGSRALIEFPRKIADQLIDWFIVDKMSWRYLATHSISALDKAEVWHAISKKKLTGKIKVLNPALKKCLKEEKISVAQAAIKLFSNSVINFFSITVLKLFKNLINTGDEPKYTEHYGIDLALGGDGNRHFASQARIHNNGEHGHLYVNYYTAVVPKQRAGLLLGIEQSAPGKADQYGGTHDMAMSVKEYSASGGDFFCKKIRLPSWAKADYKGVRVLPLADYYDSLWNFISIDSFDLIKVSFRKCENLLGLLAPEKSLLFIKEIVSSAGSVGKEEFNQLFDHCFQEIPQVKLEHEKRVALSAKVKLSKQRIQSMPSENRDVKQTANLESTGFEEQVAILRNENNRLKKQWTHELNQLKAQIVTLQSRKDHCMMRLTNSFMRTVIDNMGWFAHRTAKKNILFTLQQRFERAEVAISVDNMVFLLKNFISVCLMNRYYQTSDVTDSAKTCLSLLRHPAYQQLTASLFPKPGEIIYQDLLNLVAGDVGASKQRRFYLAKYQKNLYYFYTVGSRSKNKLADNILNLAMSGPLYAARC